MDTQAIQHLIDHVMAPLTAFATTVGPTAIAKVGESAVNKIGEDLAEKLIEQGKQLVPVIRNRFIKEQQDSKNNTALMALDGFLGDSEAFRLALEHKLRDILQEDPAFFNELSQRVQQGSVQQIIAESSKVTGNSLLDKTGRAFQRIRARKSTVKGNSIKAE